MSNNTGSTMNRASWSSHALTDHMIVSALLAAIGAALGWLAGSAVIVAYARISAHVRMSVEQAAWVWAGDALRGGSAILNTTPAFLGYIPVFVAAALAIAGAWLGWIAMNKQNEVHKRGYQVADEDASGIAKALLGAGGAADGVALHPQARMSQAQECRHIMILGGAGAGKTTILWPVVQQIIERGDRCLIFDFKGDFTAGLSGATILAPWDARSACWQIGADVRTRIDAETLAATLVPAPEKSEQLWAHGAQGLLVALIVKLQRERGEKWGIEHLAKMIADALAHYEYLLEIVTRESPIAKAYLSGADSKMTASFLAEMASNLTQTVSLGVGQHSLARSGRARAWSVKSWLEGRTPAAAILGYLPSAPQLSQAWCASIIEQTVRTLSDLDDCDARERRIWLVLDEVPQAGKIPSIGQAIETLRSKSVRVVIGMQSIAQIRSVYDSDTATKWASSTATKIIAQTTAPEDQKWCSDLLGEREIERYQRQLSRSSITNRESQITESWAAARERVMMPSDFARLLHVTERGPRALIVAGGEAAILRWPWPTVAAARKPRIAAAWMDAGYQRPPWGSVPPAVSGADEIERAPATGQHEQKQDADPGERTNPALDPRLRAQPAARTAEQQGKGRKGAQTAQGGAQEAIDAVVDPVVGAAMDALMPGLGTALDLTRTLREIAMPRGETGVVPPAAIDKDTDRDQEREDENERG